MRGRYTETDTATIIIELGELGLDMEVEYTISREMQEDYEGDGSEPGGILLHRLDTVLSETVDSIDKVRILDHRLGNHRELTDWPAYVEAAIIESICERLYR